MESTPEKDDDEESANYISSHRELFVQVYDFSYDLDLDESYIAVIWSRKGKKLVPRKAKIQFSNISSTSKIVCCTICNISTKNLAFKKLASTSSALWINTTDEKDLKTLSNEPIKVIGKLKTDITYNEWTCDNAIRTVEDNGHKKIRERDLFKSLGFEILLQHATKSKSVNNIL